MIGKRINSAMKSIYINRFNYFIFVIIIYFICTILHDPIVWLIADFFLMFAIIARSKISFFSANTVINTYPLVGIICEYFFDFSHGLLHISELPIHIIEISICIFIFNAMLGYIVFCTNVLKKEKELLKFIPSRCTRFTCEIFAVLSSVLIIIGLPYGFFSFENRNLTALPGSSWKVLALYAVFFSIPYLKKSTIVNIFSCFTMLWFLLHAERVEFIGFLLMLVILMFNKKENNLKIKDYAKYIFIAFALVVLFAVIGNVVRGMSTDFNSILKSSLIQSSMVDIMYVFNTGVDYADRFGFIHGQTLTVYLDKFFLLNDSHNSYTAFLNNYARNAGGGYALTDGYLNFGYPGVFVQVLIQLLWINFCLKKKNNYRYFCYCFMIAMCFRYSWYGYYYYEKTPIVYVPLFLLIQFVFYKFEKKHTRRIRVIS